MRDTIYVRTLVGRGLVLIALCLATFTGGRAEAQGVDEEARGLFVAGRAAFNDARYEDALRYFREAYERSPRPALLYNIAVSADRLRRDEEALEAFEAFLAATEGDEVERRDAEARVRAIRESLARRSTPTPDPDPVSTPAPTRQGFDPLPAWIVVGASGAVAITGVILLAVGQSEADAVDGAPHGTPWLQVADAAGRAEWMRVLGWGLLGLGAAGAAAGVSWALLGGGSDERTVSLRITPLGLELDGTF